MSSCPCIVCGARGSLSTGRWRRPRTEHPQSSSNPGLPDVCPLGELACFQLHAPTSTPVVSADAHPSAHNRAPRPSARRSGPNTRRVDPELTFGTDCLFQQARRKPKAPFSLHEGTPHSSRVISVLIRIVHGGRSMGGPPTTPRSTHTKHMASAATTTSQVPDQWKWIDGRTLESARESCAD